MLLFDEELRSEIVFSHQLIILDGHRSNTSKDKVLRYFVCKGLHPDEKDIGRSKSILLLDVETNYFEHQCVLFLRFHSP